MMSDILKSHGFNNKSLPSIRLIESAIEQIRNLDIAAVMRTASAIKLIEGEGFEAAYIAESLQYHIIDRSEEEEPGIHPLLRRIAHYERLEKERTELLKTNREPLYATIIERIKKNTQDRIKDVWRKSWIR